MPKKNKRVPQLENGWNIKKENRLREWASICTQYNRAHENEKRMIKIQIKRIFRLTLLLSVIGSVLGGAAAYFTNLYMIIITSFVNALIAAITVVKNTENPEQKMAIHIEASKGYREIVYQIEQQLNIDIHERINVNTFIKDVTLKMIEYENGPESIPIATLKEKQQSILPNLTFELECNLSQLLCFCLVCIKKQKMEMDSYCPPDHEISNLEQSSSESFEESEKEHNVVSEESKSSEKSDEKSIEESKSSEKSDEKSIEESKSDEDDDNSEDEASDEYDTDEDEPSKHIKVLSYEENVKFGLFLKKFPSKSQNISNSSPNTSLNKEDNRNRKNSELRNYQLGRLDMV